MEVVRLGGRTAYTSEPDTSMTVSNLLVVH